MGKLAGAHSTKPMRGSKRSTVGSRVGERMVDATALHAGAMWNYGRNARWREEAGAAVTQVKLRKRSIKHALLARMKG